MNFDSRCALNLVAVQADKPPQLGNVYLVQKQGGMQHC